jgi:hypothetical protein
LSSTPATGRGHQLAWWPQHSSSLAAAQIELASAAQCLCVHAKRSSIIQHWAGGGRNQADAFGCRGLLMGAGFKATTSRRAAGEPEEEGATSATTSATALRAATGGPGVVACDEELVVEGACRPTEGGLWQRT